MAYVLTTFPSLWPMRWRSTGADAGNRPTARRIIRARRGACLIASPGGLLVRRPAGGQQWRQLDQGIPGVETIVARPVDPELQRVRAAGGWIDLILDSDALRVGGGGREHDDRRRRVADGAERPTGLQP